MREKDRRAASSANLFLTVLNTSSLPDSVTPVSKALVWISPSWRVGSPTSMDPPTVSYQKVVFLRRRLSRKDSIHCLHMVMSHVVMRHDRHLAASSHLLSAL